MFLLFLTSGGIIVKTLVFDLNFVARYRAIDSKPTIILYLDMMFSNFILEFISLTFLPKIWSYLFSKDEGAT